MCRFKLFVAAAMLLYASTHTMGQTYVNSAPVLIPAAFGVPADTRATVYPSLIPILNGPTQIERVTVTLHGVTHLSPDRLNVLLVSPAGKKIQLMRSTGGTASIANVTLTFATEATTGLPLSGPIVSGMYTPTVFGSAHAAPSPGPALPYSTDLFTLQGNNANGNWSLYVWNSEALGADSSIAFGWSITFSRPMQTSFSYQGVVRKDGQPIAGAANVRFTLQPSETSGAGNVALAGPIVRAFANLEKGLFSTDLDFGGAIMENQELWLQIEAESPPGSGFVSLEPRTRLAIVPQAARAMKATTADVADVANSVPWSGVTGIPPQVLSPVSGFGLNKRHTGQFTNGGPQTSLTDSGSQGTVPEGTVLVNWSLSAFTTFPSTVYSFRFRIGQILSDPVVFSFNTANVHQTISGCAMMNVPAGGAVNVDIVTERVSGLGTLNYDFNDNVGYTVVLFKAP